MVEAMWQQYGMGARDRWCGLSAHRLWLSAFILATAVMLSPAAAANDEEDGDDLPTTAQEIIDEAIRNPLGAIDFQEKRANNKHFCQIVIVDEGDLHTIPGRNTLSSFGAGGNPGRAQVTATNSSYQISVDQPLGFTLAPSNGNSDVTFSTSYAAQGSTNFSLSPGTVSQRIKRGTSTVEVHLEAQRANTPFPPGQYRAEVVLRCE